MIADLLAWSLGFGLLSVSAALYWQQGGFRFLHWSGPWAFGSCAAALACFGAAAWGGHTGALLNLVVAVPAFLAAAALLAGLVTIGVRAEGSRDQISWNDNAWPVWPVLLCTATLSAIVLLAIVAPTIFVTATCALLAIYAVAAARLAWWQCGRVPQRLALPLFSMLPALCILAVVLLSAHPMSPLIGWSAGIFMVISSAWAVVARVSLGAATIVAGGPELAAEIPDERRTPPALHDLLVRHFSGGSAQPVVLLRFDLNLCADRESSVAADVDDKLSEKAMQKAEQVLRRSFRADDRIVQERSLRWSVICVGAGPTEANKLVARIREQVGDIPLRDARGGQAWMQLNAGVSVRCDTLGACEDGWQQASEALYQGDIVPT